jgi:hypothetical protein
MSLVLARCGAVETAFVLVYGVDEGFVAFIHSIMKNTKQKEKYLAKSYGVDD